MNSANLYLKIHWDGPKSQKKANKKSLRTIGFFSLILGLICILLDYFSGDLIRSDYSIHPSHRGYLGLFLLIFSIVSFYKYLRIPKAIRKLLQTKNFYSLELKKNSLIYSENFVQKKIYYKRIKEVCFYTNQSISVRYFQNRFSPGGFAYSVDSYYFHIPFEAFEINHLDMGIFLDVFQRKIREYNSHAELINNESCHPFKNISSMLQ